MNKQPIYVYDSRTQFIEPIFVVFDLNHVERVITALFGETRPEFLFVTTMRHHKHPANDPYLGKTSIYRKPRFG